MRMEELEVVCQEAARNLVQRADRPVPATVILPLATSTKVLSLPEWPDDDDARTALLERFAGDVMTPANAPCYGFVAEGVAEAETGPVDVVVVVYGARRNHPLVTAAVLHEEGVADFTEAEPLAPTAFPFLAPLQRATESAQAPDAFGLS